MRRLPIPILLALLLVACGKTHPPLGNLQVDASVSFDPTPVGGATTRKVLVKDTGKGPLSIKVQAEYPFTATPATVDLDPGAFTTIAVRFAPEHEGDYQRVLRLDHLGGGPSTIDLLGSAACVCDDGDACTTDTCGEHGACVATPITCPPAAGLCWSPICDPKTGCDQVPVPDGTSCASSGTGLCGSGSSCQGGECVANPTGLSQTFSIDLPARAGRVLADGDGNLYFVADGQLRSYDITGAQRFAVDARGAQDLELVDDQEHRVVASGPAATCDPALWAACEHLVAFALDGSFAWDVKLPEFTRGIPAPTLSLAVAAAGDRYWIAQMLGPSSCSPTTSWLSNVEASNGASAGTKNSFATPTIVDVIADETNSAWVALGNPCDPKSGISWRVRNPDGNSTAPMDRSSRLSAFGGRVFSEAGQWSTVSSGTLQGFFHALSFPLQPAVSSLSGPVDIPPLGSADTGWRVGCDENCGDPSVAGLAASAFSSPVSGMPTLVHIANGSTAPGPLLLDDQSVLVAMGSSLYQVSSTGTSALSCDLGREVFSLVTVSHGTVVAVVGPPATRSVVGYSMPLHLATSGWVATEGTPGRTRHPL